MKTFKKIAELIRYKRKKIIIEKTIIAVSLIRGRIFETRTYKEGLTQTFYYGIN